MGVAPREVRRELNAHAAPELVMGIATGISCLPAGAGPCGGSWNLGRFLRIPDELARNSEEISKSRYECVRQGPDRLREKSRN